MLWTLAMATPDGALLAFSQHHEAVWQLAQGAAEGCETGAPRVDTDRPWALECRTEQDGHVVQVDRYGDVPHARAMAGAADESGDRLMAWPSGMAPDAVDVGADVPWSQGTARLWVSLPADLPPDLRGGGTARLVSVTLSGLDREWLEAAVPNLGVCAPDEPTTVTITLSDGGQTIDAPLDCIQSELRSQLTEDLVGGATVTVAFEP